MTCQMYPRYTLAGSYDHAKLKLAGVCFGCYTITQISVNHLLLGILITLQSWPVAELSQWIFFEPRKFRLNFKPITVKLKI